MVFWVYITKKWILVPGSMDTINTTSPDYVLHLSGCFKQKNGENQNETQWKQLHKKPVLCYRYSLMWYSGKFQVEMSCLKQSHKRDT